MSTSNLSIFVVQFSGSSIVSDVLNLTNDHICELRLLTRPQIVEVLKSFGIIGPDYLIYQLLNQSEGRPGLAATLVYLWQRGDRDEVFWAMPCLNQSKQLLKDLLEHLL